MASWTRFSRACAAWLLVLPGAIADPGGGVPFAAELEPAGPVQGYGTVGFGPTSVLQFPPVASGRPLFTGATLEVLERSGSGGPAGRPSPLSWLSYLGDDAPAKGRFQNASLLVDHVHADAMLWFHAAAGGASASGAECTLSAAGRPVRPDPDARARAPATPLLDLACRGASLNATGPFHLTFVRTTGRIRHVVDGEEQEHVFGTATADRTYREDAEAVHIRVTRARLAIPLSRETMIAAHAPSVRVEGMLELPPSVGPVRWGDWRGDALPVGAQVPGNIHVEPTGPRALRFTGGAFDGPPLDPPADATHGGEGTSGRPYFLPGLGLVAFFALRPFRSSLWALFTRLTRADALHQRWRRELLDLVGQAPGASVHELSVRLGISWKLARYHVDVLERQGLVVLRHFGRETAVFGPSTPPGLHERLFLERKPQVRQLVDALRTRRQSQADLARRLGWSPAYVSMLHQRLRRAGIL